jgi:hypothetical protein
MYSQLRKLSAQVATWTGVQPEAHAEEAAASQGAQSIDPAEDPTGF